MAIVQGIRKPPWNKTCAQWADHFTVTMDSKTNKYTEIQGVFDHYGLPTSLKKATRDRRQGGKLLTTYHVEDSTPVGE